DTAMAVIGDPDTCSRIIERWQGAGIDQLLLMINAGTTSHERILGAIELFGEKVLPRFQDRPAAPGAPAPPRSIDHPSRPPARCPSPARSFFSILAPPARLPTRPRLRRQGVSRMADSGVSRIARRPRRAEPEQRGRGSRAVEAEKMTPSVRGMLVLD